MTSYTGVVRTIPLQGVGEAFPMVNPFNNYRMPSGFRPGRRVYTAVLTGTAAAIATDDYTFTLTTVDRSLTVEACFIVDPVGVSAGPTNYNTFALKNGATTLCSATTVYGVIAGEPWEVTRANTSANRLCTLGDSITLVITGASAGKAINHGTMVFVVCSPA